MLGMLYSFRNKRKYYFSSFLWFLLSCVTDFRGVQVKTYPCQNVPNQNVPSFGQNVPSPPKRTQPFGQNVPNIFFPDIQYIYLLFGFKKKLSAQWSKRTQLIIS